MVVALVVVVVTGQEAIAEPRMKKQAADVIGDDPYAVIAEKVGPLVANATTGV